MMKREVSATIYDSFFRISATSVTIIAVLEVLMLVYTVVDPSLFGENIATYRLFYVTLLSVALVYIALSLYARRDLERRFRLLDVANPLCCLCFYTWSLGVTYLDSLVYQTVDPTVFMTFALCVPLAFYLQPMVYAISATIADCLMLRLTATVAGSLGSLINLCIFFVFQLVLGVSFMRLQKTLAEHIVEEHENAVLDIMTGFANRRAYEQDVSEPESEQMFGDLVYIAIDINGLKTVNDTLGHDDGDRLICGAAQCMEQSFGQRGRLYRIGGDEFVALVSAEEDELGTLFEDFEKGMELWSAQNGIPLSASYGFVRRDEFPDEPLSELGRIADERMYEAKDRYYQETGEKRRGLE